MRWFGVLLLMAASAGASWYVRGQRMDAHARMAVARAAALEVRVDQLRQEAEDSDRAAAFNGEKVLAAEKAVQRLRAALPPMPAPIPAGASTEVRLASIAPLETRLAADEALIGAQDAQAEAFRAHVASLVTSRDAYKAALAVEQQRGDTLNTVASLPKWSLGVGTSIDPRDGRQRVAVYVSSHLSRQWSIGGGSINGGGFAMAVYSWGSM